MQEEVAQRCSVKIVFLEVSQNSQENTSVRVSFLICKNKVKIKNKVILLKKLLTKLNQYLAIVF